MVPHSPPIPPQQKKMTGRIRVWDPPRVFEHEWNQAVLSAPEPGVVRYELIPDGEGTLLRFSHRGLDDLRRSGISPRHPRVSGPARGSSRRAALARLGQALSGRRPEARHPVDPIEGNNMSHNGTDIAAPTVAVVYHSGFGHTSTLADAVAAGAHDGGAEVTVMHVETMTDEDWDVLDNVDAMIFGSPTYMGNVSGGFQTFAEKTGRRCMDGTWRDKVAAGVHELRSQERRQARHAELVGDLRRATPHALGEPGFGCGLEQRGRQRARPEQARVLAGRRGRHRRGCRARPGAPGRCPDLPPPRTAGRSGDASAQHRPHVQSSGFSSCSIVGTSSLTVGWMCMVRDIAV